VCERCQDPPKPSITVLDPPLEGECEGQNPDECEHPAKFVVGDWLPEGHLCEKHMQQENRQLNEGKGEFLRQFGMQAAVDFLPITARIPCGAVENFLRQSPAKRCEDEASWVKFALEEFLLCEEHARKMNAI
jgi:hypothetical protein